MFQKALILGLFSCLLWLGTAQAKAEIQQLHVNTVIQMRYAITNVHAKLRNPLNIKSDVTFELYIPKEAFISNFTMIIKDKTYEAKVLPKQKAEDVFANSQTSSALLHTEVDQTKFKDGRQVKFTARLDPGEKATFYLKYEELLERKDKGKYVYEFNVQPKQQKIEDFDVKLIIYETKALKDISVHKRDSKDEHSGQLLDLTSKVLEFDEKTAPYNAYISLQNDTEDELNNGEEWKLVLKYDVERSVNEVQIGPDGKFIHYFNPDSLPSLRKHLIFVIDTSGSMDGRKIQQTTDAMTMILEDMNKKQLDYVDILTFSNTVRTWTRSNGKSTLNVKEDGVMDAYKFVMNLAAFGGTFISGALLDALDKAKSVIQSGEMDSKVEQAIVFLTDGDPTVGMRSTSDILHAVKQANNDLQIPIYSLAFGNGADFEFLTQLSKDNHGFARQIYEGGNSFEQLENFYNEISDPKLKNVEFQYKVDGQFLSPQLLTKTKVEKVFGANEYIITGSFEANDTFTNEFAIVLKANNGTEPILKEITPDTCNPWARSLDPNCPNFEDEVEKSDFENSIEHLWAYKRIFYLLEEGTNCLQAFDHDVQVDSNNKEQCKEEAIKLAQKFNFVTDVTSMVIEESDEYVSGGSIDGVQDQEPPRIYYRGGGRGGSGYGGFQPNSVSQSGYQPNSAWSSGSGFQPNSVSQSGGQFQGSLRARARGGRGRSKSAPSSSGYQPNSFQNSYTSVSKSLAAASSGGHQPNSAFDHAPDSAINSIDSGSTRGQARKSGWQPVNTIPNRSVGLSNPSCSLTLFSGTYLRGDSRNLTDDVPDLSSVNFDNQVGSLQVDGDDECCWVLYEHINFQGESMYFEPGVYRSATEIRKIFKMASSAMKCKKLIG